MSLTICHHPLIQDHLHYLRSQTTGTPEFRGRLGDLSMLVAVEATRDLPSRKAKVRTPLADTETQVLSEPYPVLVPILRAGLAMVDAFLRLMPQARVGHVGVYRDERTFRPVSYYHRFPSELENSTVYVLDPMLATGGSASYAVGLVKQAGGRRVRLVSVIAAPEGVAVLEEHHPDVPIFAAALDQRLNERAYIVPGLGDAGDRVFGT